MYVCAMCATSPPYTQKICRNRTDITDHLLRPSRTSVLMPCGTVRTGPYVTITVMEMETLRLGSTAELPAEPRETVVIKIVRDLLSSPLAAPRWTANKGLERFYNTITRLLYFCFGLPVRSCWGLLYLSPARRASRNGSVPQKPNVLLYCIAQE